MSSHTQDITEVSDETFLTLARSGQMPADRIAAEMRRRGMPPLPTRGTAMLNDKALEAAREEFGTNHDRIITAYLSALPMPDVKGLVEGWRKAAEGVTPNWRLAPHYNAGWGVLAKEPSPNKWTGVYEPIPGQDLGSRSGIVTVGIKGAEVDDYWLYIKEPDARWLERCSPSGIGALLSALTTLSAKLSAAEAENARLRGLIEAKDGALDSLATAYEALLPDVAEHLQQVARHEASSLNAARAALKETDNA